MDVAPLGLAPPHRRAGARRDRVLSSPLLRRLRRRRPAFRKILLHARRDAVPAHLLEPDRMDAQVLLLVFDLVAAFLDIDRYGALLARLDAEERAALPHGERIAQSADSSGKIARREFAGVEMLVG